MKCYIINLDRAPERMFRMENLCRRLDIVFQRISAVDATLFSQEQINSYRPQLKYHMELTPGELGCGESHLKALREFVSSGDQFATILEDDIHLSSDARQFLNSDKWIPPHADMIKLETFGTMIYSGTRAQEVGSGRCLLRLFSSHMGTAAYIISRDAAAWLLDNYTAGIKPIDDYLFDDCCKLLNILQLTPAIAIQDSINSGHMPAEAKFLESGLQKGRNQIWLDAPPKKLRRIAKLHREVRRAIRNLSRFMNIHLLRRIRKTHVEFRH